MMQPVFLTSVTTNRSTRALAEIYDATGMF